MRTPTVFLLLSLLTLGSARAQTREPDCARFGETTKAVFDAALSRMGTYPMLEKLCEKAPRRLSGSPAAATAVEWARRTMAAAGLENVRLEPVTVPHWVRGEVESLRITAPAEAAGELPILALGGSVATPEEGITAGVIAVQTFEELEKRAGEAKGRIVLFNRPMDRTLLDTGQAYGGAVGQRVRGASRAARVGAVAAIVRSMTTRTDDVPHTGVMAYEEGVPRIPTAAVSTRGADRIAALLAAGKEVTLHLRLSCVTKEDTPSHNVVGELKGSARPEEIVLVGAHLDAWDVGQGAHDDGAGCCQAIEGVRILKQLGLRPRRTIRVVLFMNEENGLRGGRAYAKDHAGELAKHVMALESDSGGFTPRGFSTDANPAALEVLRAIAKHLGDAGAGEVRPGGGGADISPMVASGVIQVGYRCDTQRYFDFHHTETDTIDKVNERELELGTAAIASLVYAVADLEETLPRNEPPATK